MTQTSTQTCVVNIVSFAHDRLNYGEPKFALAKDPADAQSMVDTLEKFFDPGHDETDLGINTYTPDEFLDNCPNYSAEETWIDFDRDNPEHTAWVAELDRLAADDD
jgi:hypothetical protein